MAIFLELQRVFRIGGRDLPDPNPALTPEEVLKHFSREYPRLVGAKVIEPIVIGDSHVYEFKQANFGDRG